MGIRDLLRQKYDELPRQIDLLRGKYDAEELRSYEARMQDGLEFLIPQDNDLFSLLESIRHPSRELLENNARRYFAALDRSRKKEGKCVSNEQVHSLIDDLKTTPLMHSTGNIDVMKRDGIHPASDLWMTSIKSRANAMDIALGLDEYVFLTHGYTLDNYGDTTAELQPAIIDRPSTLVSSVDIFKLVLHKTKQTLPASAPTHEWVSVLPEYERHIFAGKDYWRLQAEYILTFFENADSFRLFAKDHFYDHETLRAPDGEQPFLGEIKVKGTIKATDFLYQ